MAKIPLSLLFATTLLPATANALTFQAQDLGNFSADSPTSNSNLLDSTGRVAGYFFAATNNQAYLYNGSYTSLGNLGGSGGTYVNALNPNFIVGTSQAPTAQHAFLYDGTIHDLGSLGGFSTGNAVNATGTVVGTSFSTAANTTHGFLYDGSLHDITPTATGSSGATGIANDGRVAGYFTPSGSSSTHAFLYQSGSLQDLNSLIPASSSVADGITANGVLFGRFNGTGIFVYDGTIHTDSAGLASLVSFSSDGKIAGYDSNGALFYNDGTFTSLALGSNSQADAINAAGQIVGRANGHAFFYDGTFHDLNSLVSLPNGWVLTGAYSINDQSQILAQGFNSSLGKSDAFLLSVPEPATLSLTFAGFLLLSARRHNARI